jgi:hypothetical protein
MTDWLEQNVAQETEPDRDEAAMAQFRTLITHRVHRPLKRK